MFSIKTQRLCLRDFHNDDIHAYRAIRRDEKFQRFCDEDDARGEKADDLLRLFIDQAAERPRLKYQLAIVSLKGELLGTCGIRTEAPGLLSIGCEVGRFWHGTGIAREAGTAMIDFGFSDLGADKIYAETLSENKAAIRLCQSLSMDVEEERKDDQYFKQRLWDTTVLTISRSKWERSHN